MRFTRFACGAAIALLMAGCAGRQAETAKFSGFLGQDVYKNMEYTEGKNGAALYRYTSEQAKDPAFMASFRKLRIDPVQVYLPASERKALKPADAQAMANNAYVAFYKALAKDYQIVQEVGPGVLRLSVAITKLEAANVTSNAISTVVPVSLVATQAYSYADDEPAVEGQVAAEGRLTDGGTGQVLVAAVDRRIGGKGVDLDKFDSWVDVNDAFKVWAERTRLRLCESRGAKNCQRK